MRDLYFQFVRARHQAWLHRMEGAEPPWSDDPIVQTRKFTNVFRILDRGTQFVAKDLLYSESAISFNDALMRCFLYRYTNRPEPWIYFRKLVGRYPLTIDLSGQLQHVWYQYKADGNPMFGNAFKMFVGAENKGKDRLTWVLDLTRDVFSDPKFSDKFLKMQPYSDRMTWLETIPRCANFMGMQILTDIGYSHWIQANEDQFIIPGPGALIGARHISLDTGPITTIYQLRDHWRNSEDEVILPGIWRIPSLMDIQNTLCEFGKYMRWREQPIRSKPYTGIGKLPEPFYPPHWKGTE